MKDLFDFKPGMAGDVRRNPVAPHQVIDAYCTYSERMEGAGAIIVGKTNSPVMGCAASR